jgi:hypothetical protein
MRARRRIDEPYDRSSAPVGSRAVHALASIFLLAAETADHAEKDKTPFYVAGALLAVWAVVVSAVGITRPDFPGSGGATRAVYAISLVLVAGAMSMAIATAG